MTNRKKKQEKDWENREAKQKELQNFVLNKMKQNKEKNQQYEKEEVSQNVNVKHVRELKKKIEKLEKTLEVEKVEKHKYQKQYHAEKEQHNEVKQNLFQANNTLEEYVKQNQELENAKSLLEKRLLFFQEQLEKKEESIGNLQRNNRGLHNYNHLLKQENLQVMRENKELERIVKRQELSRKFSEAKEILSMVEEDLSLLMTSFENIFDDLNIKEVNKVNPSDQQVLKGVKILIIGSRQKKIHQYVEGLEKLGANAISYDAYSKSLHLLSEKFSSADIVLACKQHIPHDVENVVDTNDPKYKLIHTDNLSTIIEVSMRKAIELELIEEKSN